MNSIETRAAAVRAQIEAGKPGEAIVAKIVESRAKNPTVAAFNYWQANNDIGIGSDTSWGSQA